MDIGKLNDLYYKSESVDKRLFSEMRSNILLTSGDHYKKTGDKLLRGFRHTKHSEYSKLRLVKNHIQRITKIYKNAILNAAPGVRVFPYNDNELADFKTAELNQSVWEDAKQRHNFKSKTRSWCDNFIEIGECATKMYWDPNKGELIGYQQAMDEDSEPMLDEQGNPMPDKERPVFSGDVVFEKVLPFNLMRDPRAETMEESPYVIVRKMVDLIDAKNQFPDKEEMIEESAKETFKVFEGHNGVFRDAKEQVMYREYYYRPCMIYPRGYYYITTEKGILSEGELPGGIFPVIWEGDEEIPTSARGRSLIKHLRPYQGEINRAASAIATTQITLGDDRVFVLNGSKVSKGIHMPGIRVFNVSGQEPKIQAGRAGDQYFDYLQAQIREMYQIAELDNVNVDKPAPEKQTDIYPLLYRSMRDKKKFSLKAEKFENFLVNVAKTYLELAKLYYDDNKFVRAAGRREAVNIAEFKATSINDIRFKVEPAGEDAATTIGRAVQLGSIMQYFGSDLPDEAKGEIIKMMPFLNGDQIVSSLTLDFENVTSDILALDRGEWRDVGRFDNHKEYIRRLTNRMKQKDFDQLDPQIQNMFNEKLRLHEEAEVKQVQELQEAQAGFIPTGGGLTKTDLYEPDPKSPEKQRRATFPVEALQWLKGRLDAQGLTQQQMASLQEQNLIEMNQLMNQQGGGMDADQIPVQPPITNIGEV